MAGNDTAALVVALSAQLTKFEKDMKSAGDIADRQVSSIEDRFQQANPTFSGLKALIPAGLVAGALASIKTVVDSLAELGDKANDLRIPVDKLQALLTRIGRVQTLLTKIRYSAVTTLRMLSFLTGSNRFNAEDQKDVRYHLASLTTDVTSLSEHTSYLVDSLTFQLDASLGLISIEQNAAMKLFSWAAVVFLPPTLIAGIYGMNFHEFPELSWPWGYPMALALMLATAVGPYLYFKKRGWI